MKRIISWLLVIIWMLLIFYLSDMNTVSSNQKSKKTISEAINRTIETTNKVGITDKHPSTFKKEKIVSELNHPLRKVAHATVYLVLSLLIVHALYQHPKAIKISYIFMITIILCFMYSCSDEFHQTKVYGRTGQINDIFIDTLGFLIGTTIAIGLIGIKRRNKNDN